MPSAATGRLRSYHTGALQPVTYHVPAYKFEGVRVLTNKPPCGPKRGHGTVQPRFALECHLDKVATDLGIDLIDIRLRNLIEPYSLSVNYMRVTTCGLRECIELVEAASGWRQKHGRLRYGRRRRFALGAYLMRRRAADLLQRHATVGGPDQGRSWRRRHRLLNGVRHRPGLAQHARDRRGRSAGPASAPDIALIASDTDLTPIDLGKLTFEPRHVHGRQRGRASGRAYARQVFPPLSLPASGSR